MITKLMRKRAGEYFLAVCALACITSLECVAATDLQCKVQRRAGVALDAVNAPATILREFTDIPDLQGCIQQCCLVANEGCTAAAIINTTTGGHVCAIAKCSPWSACVFTDYANGGAAMVELFNPAVTGLPTQSGTTFGKPDAALVNVSVNVKPAAGSPTTKPRDKASTAQVRSSTSPSTSLGTNKPNKPNITTKTKATATTVTRQPMTSAVTWSTGNSTASTGNTTTHTNNSPSLFPQNPIVTSAVVLGIAIAIIVLGVLARKAFSVYKRAEYKPLKEGFLQSYSD